MTDRELLELAAKAAGFDICQVLGCGGNFYGLMIYKDRGDGAFGMSWNPLDSDGDALQLALKLGICIVFMEDVDSVGAEHSRYGVMIVEAMDDYGTRRAITRAAAEIGKAMP